MITTWRRPRNTDYDNDEVISFTGQNAELFVIKFLSTAEAREQALDLIMQERRDDPIIGTIDLDRLSEVFLRNWIEMYLDQEIALGCYTHREGTLVAVDNLYVRNIRDTFPVITEDFTEGIRIFLKYTKIIERHVWYKSPKKVCNFLTSSGVYISPAYRNLGITEEMIRMRIRVAKSLQIEIIGAAFIGIEMQDAAKKHKYRILETIRHPQDMVDPGLGLNYGQIFPIEIWGKYIKVKGNRQVGENADNDNFIEEVATSALVLFTK